MAKILIGLVAFLWTVIPAYSQNAEAVARKREMERLQKQAAQKENELQKYRQQEKRISREISDLETKKIRTQRLKSKLESDLSSLEQNMLSVGEKRTALKRSMQLWQDKMNHEITSHYLTPTCELCVGGYSLEQNVFRTRALAHQAAFTAQLQQENQDAQALLQSIEERNRHLQEQSSRIQQEQQVISQSFRKKKQDLAQTKRKVKAVRKEINELNKSATALNNWLAAFERRRKSALAKAQKTGEDAAENRPQIDVPMHSLPWPVKGKVISKFGKEYRADLNTWIFREGIKIAARPGEVVRTVAEGSIIYAGPFRSYGNVAILDHGKGFFSIYGFLREIHVSVGDRIARQGVVGTAGQDTQSSSGTGQSAVYFEIRQGAAAADPQQWLKEQQ